MITKLEKLELIYAATQDNYNRVSQLLRKIDWAASFPELPSSLSRHSPIDMTILSLVHIAIKNNNQRILNLIITHYPDAINQPDLDGFTPLILACYHNKLDMVKCLLCYTNLNINQLAGSQSIKYKGYTALHIAIKKKYSEIADLLLNKNADRMIKTPFGLGLIHLAAESGSEKNVKKLIDHNPALLRENTANKSSVLMLAIYSGNLELVCYLIERHLTHKIPLPKTNTLLSLALKYDHPDIFTYCVNELQPVHPIDINIAKEAVEKGLSEVVLFSIWHNNSLGKNQSLVKNLLIFAIQINKKDMFRLLIEELECKLTSNFNEEKESYTIAKQLLLEAIKNGSEDVLDDLNVRCLPALRWTELDVIYDAAKYGCVSTLKSLIKARRELINERDAQGNLPLHWAASYCQYEATEYLLNISSVKLDLFVPNISDLNTQSYHLLDHLIEVEEWGTCNLIIKKFLDSGQNDYLDYIKTRQQAKEFVVIYPAYQSLLKQDSRINSLFLMNASIGNYEPIYIYKTRMERGISFFGVADMNRGDSQLFTPDGTLGQGVYGEVRLFKNNTGCSIAVKSAFESETLRENGLASLTAEGEQEAAMLRKAYPNQQFSHYQNFFNQIDNKRGIYTNRLIMDYREGETLDQYIYKTANTLSIASVLLSVIEELDALHKKNIIHGDIRPSNIIIDYSRKVYFIDFGFSKDNSAIIPASQIICEYFAPELNENPAPILAHPNQDMYSVGYWLERILIEHPVGYHLATEHPSLIEFVDKALVKEPNNRPLLADFINKLSDEINLLVNGRSNKVG